MKSKRQPLSPIAKLTRSHLRLLKVQRGLITEIGELRKVILEMRPKPETPGWYPQHYFKDGLVFKNTPYQPKEFDVPPNDEVATEKCPSCNTPVMVAAGIGPFCPNKNCWRIDDLLPDVIRPNDWPRL